MSRPARYVLRGGVVLFWLYNKCWGEETHSNIYYGDTKKGRPKSLPFFVELLAGLEPATC